MLTSQRTGFRAVCSRAQPASLKCMATQPWRRVCAPMRCSPPRARPSKQQESTEALSAAAALREDVRRALKQLAVLGATLALSASLVCGAIGPAPAFGATKVLRLPASNDPEVFQAQRTMVEAWTIVGESYVDPEFNHHNWPEELQRHMVAAYASDDPTAAWAEINAMLGDLGDPYTRRIDPDEYQAFRVSTDGELQGIGLLIANELSDSGHLRVLAPIRGGPADRAGILPGDEVVSINGQDTTGWSGDQVARVLRGRGGSEVVVKLARRTDGIPGVPARPEPALLEQPVTFKEVSLRREAVVISPVYSTLLASAPAGMTLPVGGAASLAGAPVGYVRLSQFSNNAADDMRKALHGLKAQGAGGYILDLRSNPGGLVKAGVDVASLWLDGQAVVFTVASRDDGVQIQTTESVDPALTRDPLVVLVDGNSASASEIVSGALHDNHRAVVMGDVDHTYGKGRIQSVFELQDGSALFVTVAKYRTPGGKDIDQRGIRPDRTCRLPAIGGMLPTRALTVASPAAGPGEVQQHSVSSRPLMSGAPMVSDPGEKEAVGMTWESSADTFIPGVPLDAPTEAMLVESLTHDKCVLAAAHYLDSLRAGGERSVQEEPPLTAAQTLYLALIEEPNRATF